MHSMHAKHYLRKGVLTTKCKLRNKTQILTESQNLIETNCFKKANDVITNLNSTLLETIFNKQTRAKRRKCPVSRPLWNSLIG